MVQNIKDLLRQKYKESGAETFMRDRFMQDRATGSFQDLTTNKACIGIKIRVSKI